MFLGVPNTILSNKNSPGKIVRLGSAYWFQVALLPILPGHQHFLDRPAFCPRPRRNSLQAGQFGHVYRRPLSGKKEKEIMFKKEFGL